MSPAARGRLIRLGVATGAGIGLLLLASGSGLRAAEFDANGNQAPRVIGGRPHGCPHAFCGCGLARFLGLEDRRLWLAANWPRLLHRTQAHAGAVAARAHHVMLLVEHIAGTRWLVKDWNGGRHLTWEHVRDVRGYVFVDPSNRVGALQ